MILQVFAWEFQAGTFLIFLNKFTGTFFIDIHDFDGNFWMIFINTKTFEDFSKPSNSKKIFLIFLICIENILANMILPFFYYPSLSISYNMVHGKIFGLIFLIILLKTLWILDRLFIVWTILMLIFFWLRQCLIKMFCCVVSRVFTYFKRRIRCFVRGRYRRQFFCWLCRACYIWSVRLVI